MNQPPEGPYDSPTENTPLPPQWQQGQYPQQVSAPNYPPNAGQPGPGGFPGQPQPGPGAYPVQPGPGGFPGQPQPGFPQQPGQPPSWPNMAQPPQPRKKTNIGCIITAVVLILVLLVGGAAAFLYARSQQQANSATPTAAAGTQTANATSTTAPKTTPTVQANGGPGVVGQPSQAGSIWVVTVTRASTTTSSSFPPKPGQTYLEISVSLQNVSTSPQVVASLVQFNLKDTNNASYNETLTDTNITKSLDGTVNPQQTLNGQIAFEVPQSMHTFLFTFIYGLTDGSNASLSWPITV